MDWKKRLMGLIDTLSARAVGRSTHLAEVNDGRWTKPVKASAGRVAWPAYEVEAQIAARIAGKTDAEIRQLVNELEAARQKIAMTPGEINLPTKVISEAAEPQADSGWTHSPKRRREKRSVAPTAPAASACSK